MTMSGDQQSHICTFCGRRTYACVSVPGGIACPTCKIRRREERCAAGLDQPLPNCECARCRKPRAKLVTPAESKPVEPDPPPPRLQDCTCIRGPDGPDPSCPAHGDSGLQTRGLVAVRAEIDFSQSRAGSVIRVEARDRVRDMSCDEALARLAETQRTLVDPQPCTCVRGSDGPDPTCPEHGEPSPMDALDFPSGPEWDQPLPEPLPPDETELADRRMFEEGCGASPEVAARFARIAREGRERAAVARRLYEQAGEVAEGWPDTRAVWADALRQLTRIGRRGD